jgi:hypothetical protein
MTLNGIIKKTTVGVATALALSVLAHDRIFALTVDGGIKNAGVDSNSGMNTSTNPTGAVGTITSIAMWAVGVVSVIVIVIAGISYATAQGDESKTKKARQAILGGLIGLAVALLAFTITSFVANQL